MTNRFDSDKDFTMADDGQCYREIDGIYEELTDTETLKRVNAFKKIANATALIECAETILTLDPEQGLSPAALSTLQDMFRKAIKGE